MAYEESANRRITLAEKLRRLPLAFFGQRDLSDLTTTMMGDCSKLERIFSNAVPSLFGTVIMFVIVSVGLLIMDWRMGLCIVLPVPVAALILIAARKAQTKAESRNYDAHRAAYDGVQEYLDTIQELRSAGLEQEYLDGVEKKLDYVVKCAFRNELAPGTAVTLAQLTVRFGLVAVLLVGGLLVAQNMLFVDESHAFKNLFLYTKMRNVAGLSTSEAQKSSDMFMKCRYMDELTGGRGVIFATGTPVSNSMTELYTVMRYLQYSTLQQKNLTHFDSWASTFGETTTAIELAPEGTGYRARTRFAKFFNLPELMNMFKEVADIKTSDQLPRFVPGRCECCLAVRKRWAQEPMSRTNWWQFTTWMWAGVRLI